MIDVDISAVAALRVARTHVIGRGRELDFDRA